jgi:type I restriction enzyme S subunit
MSEWVTNQLGNLVTFKKGKKVETSLDRIFGYRRYLGAGSLAGKHDGYASTYLSVLANDNDVLMLWDGERSGLVGYKLEGVVSSTVSKLTPNEKINTSYLYYNLFNNFEWIQNRRTGTGVPHVPKDLNRIYKVNYPKNRVYQKKIATILQTIDQTIEKTEALIEKYQQIKVGLMHDLFTRGITADGKLRPFREQAPELYQETPIGWIPKDWEVMELIDLYTKLTSGSRDWARYYSKTGDLFVRISNLTREHINFRWNSMKYVDIRNTSEGQRTKLEEGDVLISITADLGIIGVVPSNFGRAFINQHTALLRPNTSIVNPRFLGNYLSSTTSQKQFDKYNDSGAKAGLNLPTIEAIFCSIPKIDEQNMIADRIDKIDGVIAKLKVEHDKFLKQKQGLMQDLLTGKVQVKIDSPKASHA